MSLIPQLNIFEPDAARAQMIGADPWLILSRGHSTASVYTTEARARAMEFAFNNPEAVLALINDDPVTIVVDGVAV